MQDLTIPSRRETGLTDYAREDLIVAQGELEKALPILRSLKSSLRYAEYLRADVEYQNEWEEILGSNNSDKEEINEIVGEE